MGVRGNLRRVTQPVGPRASCAGPLRGSRAVNLVCVAARPSEAPCAGSAGLTQVPRHPSNPPDFM